jgi:hypothetical protein
MVGVVFSAFCAEIELQSCRSEWFLTLDSRSDLTRWRVRRGHADALCVVFS